jgi:carbon monoxide dehydrogenase subunit G
VIWRKNVPWCYFAVSENNGATNHEIPGLKSVARCSDAILSHLKFEIHVVMHLSQRRLQTRCQNINSSDKNALMALKGDGRWHSHWFIARYAQTTPN